MSNRHSTDKSSPPIPPPMVKQPPLDGRAYRDWKIEAHNANVLGRTLGATMEIQELLGPYTEQRWTSRDGTQYRGLAAIESDGGSALELPFAVRSVATEASPNIIALTPGVVYGLADLTGATEVAPRIGTLTGAFIYDDHSLTVAQSANWQFVIGRIRTTPTAAEAYGNYYLSALRIKDVLFYVSASIPTDAVAATVDPVSGATTDGIAYRTIALAKWTEGTLSITQVSYGNWHVQQCISEAETDADLRIYDPSYVSVSLDVASYDPGEVLTIPIAAGSVGPAQLSATGTPSSGTYLRGDNTWATIPSGSGTVTSVAVSGSDGIEVDSGSPVTSAGTIALGVNATAMKTHLSLGNVENTALSTWAGSTSITTLGTVTTGSVPAANVSGLGGAALLSVGTTAGTVCAGDDARLSDARTPTSHSHGNITNAGAIGSTAGLPVQTGTSGVLEAGAFGTGAGQFAEGNHTHAQLHDAATVTGNGISISGQQISLSIGTGAAQVAAGDHNHAGVYEAAGAVSTHAAVTSGVHGISAFGATLIDDATAADARTTLGLGTLATQSGTFSGTSSGTNTGDQTITLTGDVTGSGTGSFTTTISAGAVDIAMLSATGTPSASTFLRGDNTWSTPSGSGDVVGPASATDNAIVRFDSTTGKLIQTSGITIADGASGTLSGTNTGDQTITLTGDVTGSGTGSFATTISAGAVDIAMLSATGSPGSGTFLRGDNTWAAAGGLLQAVCQIWATSAEQALTTTYADVDGSSISFTPVSASSIIVYTFSFVQGTANSGEPPLGHYRLMVDGVEESDKKITVFPSSNNSSMPVTYQHALASWGTSAKTIKLQGREYGASNEVMLHRNFTTDGSGSTSLVDAVLTILEFPP